MSLVKFSSNLPDTESAMEPGTPLWQIVPTRGADGRPLVDFMMLIPGLRSCPQPQIHATLNKIQKALEQYQDDVVFVNFNLKINVLWISLNSRPGVILELVMVIQRHVPEAVVVV